MEAFIPPRGDGPCPDTSGPTTLRHQRPPVSAAPRSLFFVHNVDLLHRTRVMPPASAICVAGGAGVSVPSGTGGIA